MVACVKAASGHLSQRETATLFFLQQRIYLKQMLNTRTESSETNHADHREIQHPARAGAQQPGHRTSIDVATLRTGLEHEAARES